MGGVHESFASNKDLVGRGEGNEVTYEADGGGKCQVAIQLGC